MRYRTNLYYSIRRRPIGLVLAQVGPLNPFFTKLKLKILFSHHIYSFHTFGFPWYGSKLCATVQIHTILYDVGPMGSFWPKCARSISFSRNWNFYFNIISTHFILLVFLDPVPNYALPYKSILFYTTSAHWARFDPNRPVRSVFRETQTQTSIFTSYLLISYFFFFLDPIPNYALLYKSILFYTTSAHWARFGPNGPLDPFFKKLKLLFSHHIYSFHTFGFPWSGSELCATVQIHAILYEVGPLGSFSPEWAR